MAELPSPSPQSLPPKSETEIPPSQSDPHPQSTPQALSVATPPPPAGLNPSPNANPPTALLPTSVALFPPPAVSGVSSSLQPPVHLFRPPVPQFSTIPGAVSYQNSVTFAPGMAPPAPGSMMQYQVPVPGQPTNHLFRPFAPNGYAAMPPPGRLLHISYSFLTLIALYMYLDPVWENFLISYSYLLCCVQNVGATVVRYTLLSANLVIKINLFLKIKVVMLYKRNIG